MEAQLKIILFFLLFFLVACSPYEHEIITTIKPMTIAPPIIEEILKADIITDTVIIANTIYKNDTVTTVKYFPKEKKFYIKVKPDTIRFFDTLRTVVIKEKQKEENNKWYIFLFISAIFLIIVYKLFK